MISQWTRSLILVIAIANVSLAQWTTAHANAGNASFVKLDGTVYVGTRGVFQPQLNGESIALALFSANDAFGSRRAK